MHTLNVFKKCLKKCSNTYILPINIAFIREFNYTLWSHNNLWFWYRSGNALMWQNLSSINV